jgi:hypothetical protein
MVALVGPAVELVGGSVMVVVLVLVDVEVEVALVLVVTVVLLGSADVEF